MSYDFDRVIDRRNTNSLKWDFARQRGLPADVLPLWVADMDFQAPPCVLEALQQVTDHGIFGYSEAKEDYYEAVAAWFRGRFDWETRPEWLVRTPGVVFALAAAIRALTEPGDGVLIQPPVYYPFYEVIRDNGRVVVSNELRYAGGQYAIDFEDFEAKVREQNVKLFLLCSPITRSAGYGLRRSCGGWVKSARNTTYMWSLMKFTAILRFRGIPIPCS